MSDPFANLNVFDRKVIIMNNPQFPTNTPNFEAPKPKKKRHTFGWIAGIAGALVVGMALGGGGDDGEEKTTTVAEPSSMVAVADTKQDALGAEQEAPAEAPADDVPREYENALRSAQQYLDFAGFSEAGLYDQITSEYADQYSPEAAQYALENVNADYFAEAVESAENYLDTMPMSGPELYDQLTSEYGEQFTAEQAQHAVEAVGL